MNKADENILKKLQRLYPRAVSTKELAKLMNGYTSRELAWHLENRLKEHIEVQATETSGKRTGTKYYRFKHDTAGLED